MASLATRVRLRAPDEDAATTSAAAGAAWPSTHHRELHAIDTTPARNLPPLDVRSPEFIEQRLENLKRKPSWRAWLDQYVLEHPESDSDDEGDSSTQPHRVEIDRTARSTFVRRRVTTNDTGFVATTLWSLLIVAFTPLLLLLSPCLRRREDWPLGCTSVFGLIAHAFSTLASILFGSVLIYYALCRELPELRIESWTNVLVRARESQHASAVCYSAVQQHEPVLAQELCAPLAIDAALVLACVALVLQSHRAWAKRALLLVAVLFAADVQATLRRAVLPAPTLTLVDPSYALVDEEVVVALDGKHLKPGGSIAWVAYWGCASTAPVESCEKQFASTFDAGVVRVTFTALDHFIPCYRAPPNPLKSQEYACFEHLRLRVKGKQSIPGWSRVAAPPREQQQRIDTRSSGAATLAKSTAKSTKSTTKATKLTSKSTKSTANPTKSTAKTTKSTSAANGVRTVHVAADGAAAQE